MPTAVLTNTIRIDLHGPDAEQVKNVAAAAVALSAYQQARQRWSKSGTKAETRMIATAGAVSLLSKSTAGLPAASAKITQLKASMNGFSSTAGRASGAANRAKTSFQNLAGAFVSMFAFGLFTRGISAIVGKFAGMETALAQLKGITGASADEMASYRKEIMKVAGATPFDPIETTTALVKLRQGLGDSEAAVKSLRSTAQLSLASMGTMSFDVAAKFTGSLSKAFEVTGEEANKLGQKIFKIGRATGVGPEEFQKSMGKLGMAKFRGGQSAETIFKAFALSTSVQGSSKQDATQLLRLMGQLADKSDLMYQKLGIQAKDIKTGIVRDFGEIAFEIADKYKVMPLAVREFFSEIKAERSIKPLMAIILRANQGLKDQHGILRKGIAGWKALGAQANTAFDILKYIEDLKMQTLAGQIDMLGDELQKLAIAFGSQLAGGTKKAVSKIQDYLKVAVDALETNKELQTSLKTILWTIVGVGGSLLGAAAATGLTAVFRIAIGQAVWLLKITKAIAAYQIGGAAGSMAVTGARTAGAAVKGMATAGLASAGSAGLAFAGVVSKLGPLVAKLGLYAWGIHDVYQALSGGAEDMWDKRRIWLSQKTAWLIRQKDPASKMDRDELHKLYKESYGGGAVGVPATELRRRLNHLAEIKHREKVLDTHKKIWQGEKGVWIAHEKGLAMMEGAVKAMYDLQEKTLKSQYKWAFGMKEMRDLLSEVKAMADYKPVMIKEASIILASKKAASLGKMVSSSKGDNLDEEARRLISHIVQTMPEIPKGIDKAERGVAGSKDKAQLSYNVGTVLLAAKALNMKHPSMGLKSMIKHLTEVANALVKGGSKENIEAQRTIDALKGGHVKSKGGENWYAPESTRFGPRADLMTNIGFPHPETDPKTGKALPGPQSSPEFTALTTAQGVTNAILSEGVIKVRIVGGGGPGTGAGPGKDGKSTGGDPVESPKDTRFPWDDMLDKMNT